MLLLSFSTRIEILGENQVIKEGNANKKSLRFSLGMDSAEREIRLILIEIFQERIMRLLFPLTLFLISLAATFANAAERSIHVSWELQHLEDVHLAGFRLYGDNQDGPLCTVSNPNAREMDCIVDTDVSSMSFTMASFDIYGIESERSTSFTLAFNAPPADTLAADFETSINQNSPLTVTFDGSSSTGMPVSWTWYFNDGSAPGSGETITHNFPAPGTYTVQLAITDQSGRTSDITHQVTLSSSNQSPVARILPGSAEGQAPLSVQFNGLDSTDPEGDQLAYSWNFGDGTTGSGASISHIFTEAGVFTVVLTVTDGNGNQDTATLPVTVTTTASDPGSRPQAIITSNQSVGYKDGKGKIFKISLDGSRSQASEDGAILLQYAWNFGDGSTGEGKKTSHIYKNAGAYTITLTVTDSLGRTALSTLKVTIKPDMESEVQLQALLRIYQLLLLNKGHEPEE